MNPERRKLTAIHEGGHAIVCIALNVGVRSALLGLEDGQVAMARGPTLRESRIISAAGAVAEAFCLRRPIPTTLEGPSEWSGDATALRAAVDIDFEPADRAAGYAHALRAAAIIVDHEWEAVRRVADALCRSAWLSGEQVRAIAALPPFNLASLPLDRNQEREEVLQRDIHRQQSAMLENWRRSLADQGWRPLVRAHNARVASFQAGLNPRARNVHGDTVMHQVFQTSNLVAAGARGELQSKVLTRARQVQSDVLAGRVERGGVQAEAARSALDIASRGRIGEPLLLELERRLQQGAAA